MEAAREFFEVGSLATFGGASLAVLVLTNTYHKLVGTRTVLFGFAASQAVSFFGAYATGVLTTGIVAFVAFLNGCLLFCTAAGIQESAGAAAGQTSPEGSVAGLGSRRWAGSWFGKL